MEKQKTTAVRIEVKATIPFMFDPYAYEDAVHFYQEYANATWKKITTVTPSSTESPNNNKEGFIGHTPKD